ncbi:hypothetical protein SAMN05216276_102889 [Streptosporangium subroseum]|uniref:Uncharacterized protein n=1 Tax=Streptosporangium subroseum TaxID=106412 RepID=A0A239KT40_9ACTN|nr:hypothetical protein [Streptosporangium subroseum]SNT20783.1 hypothetical protein SAMN05216276_102889 [Streptosporangium subroseum]
MSAAAPDTCVQGYVWRGARPTDHVCVTPAVRDQTARDNQVKASRWVSGAFGAHTCAQGYVWREAFSGDDVCVTSTVRQQVRADNAAAAGRVARGASNGAASASTASKSFSWGKMNSGDCWVEGAKWTLYSDGVEALLSPRQHERPRRRRDHG